MSSLIDRNLAPESWLIEQNNEAQQLLLNPLLEKDIWRTIEDLGLEVAQHNKVLTISFNDIKQDWFKLLVKLYVLIRSQRKLESMYIRNEVHYLSRFSQIMTQQIILVPEQIKEQIFEEFNDYLKSLNLSKSSVSKHYTALNNFFNVCRQEGWLNVNTYWFKGRCSRVSPNNNDIKYIPEEIWQQLEEHLHYLPEPIPRMVLVIRATGLRIGEILNLPLDCLRERNKKWRLRFLTEKYKIEDEIPICAELVIVIQGQ